MLRHDMHGVRRILRRSLWGWGLKFSDMGRYDLGLPFLKRDGFDERFVGEHSTQAKEEDILSEARPGHPR